MMPQHRSAGAASVGSRESHTIARRLLNVGTDDCRYFSVLFTSVLDYSRSTTILHYQRYTKTAESRFAGYSYGTMSTLALFIERMTKCLRSSSFYSVPAGGVVAKERGRYTGRLKRSWLSSIGFFLRTTFPIEMNGNFGPL